MKFIGIFFVLAVIISGCIETKEQAGTNYFSISSFLTAETQLLEKQHVQIDKKVTQKSTTETKREMLPDWKQELKPFFECDIDKAAWKNSYTIDTAVTDSSMVIYYKSKEKKAPVRLMSVNYINGKVTTIYISFEKSNAWFAMKQELTYYPNKGYIIKGEQKMALADKNTYEISANYIQP